MPSLLAQKQRFQHSLNVNRSPASDHMSKLEQENDKINKKNYNFSYNRPKDIATKIGRLPSESFPLMPKHQSINQSMQVGHDYVPFLNQDQEEWQLK